MGFRNGCYATVWSVEPKSDTNTSVKLTVSRKNKQTEKFETEFSGFVSFYGTAIAKKAACLKEGDRIKLGDVDVTNNFVKEKGVTYTNFKCFSFEPVEGSQTNQPQTQSVTEPQPTVDSGEVNDDRLPF